jgi:hypothetical protein
MKPKFLQKLTIAIIAATIPMLSIPQLVLAQGRNQVPKPKK